MNKTNNSNVTDGQSAPPNTSKEKKVAQKNYSIKVWERSVEFAFAQWAFGRRCQKMLISLALNKDFELSEVNINKIFGDLYEKLPYQPIAGNLEKAFGDGFFETDAKYCLLEFKANLASSEWGREANDADGSKGRRKMLELLSVNASGQQAIENSKKCHFLVGMVREKIRFNEYWDFIASAEIKDENLRYLNSLEHLGLSFGEFGKYLKTLLIDGRDGGDGDISVTPGVILKCTENSIETRPATREFILDCLQNEKMVATKSNDAVPSTAANLTRKKMK